MSPYFLVIYLGLGAFCWFVFWAIERERRAREAAREEWLTRQKNSDPTPPDESHTPG